MNDRPAWNTRNDSAESVRRDAIELLLILTDPTGGAALATPSRARIVVVDE
jgi:hypothetical protein